MNSYFCLGCGKTFDEPGDRVVQREYVSNNVSEDHYSVCPYCRSDEIVDSQCYYIPDLCSWLEEAGLIEKLRLHKPEERPDNSTEEVTMLMQDDDNPDLQWAVTDSYEYMREYNNATCIGWWPLPKRLKNEI